MSTQRSLRVSQSIKRELAEIIKRDLENKGITGLVSITDVECAPDCRAAKIFVSVFGDETAQNNTMEVLNENMGFIRGEICRRLQLRFAPELHFKLDHSLERGAKITELINKVSRGEV